MQDFVPRAAWVGDAPCQLQVRTARPMQVTPADAFAAAPTPLHAAPDAAPAAGRRRLLQAPMLGAVSVVDAQLYGVDGQPLTIRGANWRVHPACAGQGKLCALVWVLVLLEAMLQGSASAGMRGADVSHGAGTRFGFETGFTMVHGLWQGPFAVTQDWLTVAYRMQLLGFNTIRLPMSFPVDGPPPVCSSMLLTSVSCPARLFRICARTQRSTEHRTCPYSCWQTEHRHLLSA